MAELEPVRKELRVRCTPDHAFRVFTERMSEWWPLATHSIAGDRAKSCGFEPHEGGAIWELDDAGNRHRWGRVLAWKPPHRLELAWHPGRDPATEQRVEVTFEAANDEEGEATEVVLVHRDWDKLLEDAPNVRKGYETGWDRVLSGYVALSAGTSNPA